MKAILLMMLFFSGAVLSAPEIPHERNQYAASLNSMASIVMNRYACILNAQNQCSGAIESEYWQDYIERYPEGITQIEITGTNLIRLEEMNQYQFIVDIKFRDKQGGIARTQSMSDTFLFLFNASQQIILKKITSTKPQLTEAISENKFTHSYFNHREVAYAWLSYLDGAILSDEIKKQFSQVKYSLVIGSQFWQGPVISTLSKRQPYLSVGGHILRVVTVEPSNQMLDTHTLNLTIEWRGVDKDNTPVWANVQQIIEYKLLKNGEWEIISVNEKHLLPDTEPWIGLLC